MPFNPLKINRLFGETSRFHLHGQHLLRVGFLLALFVDAEDGGDIFLQKVC
jgi:hypothetical protein